MGMRQMAIIEEAYVWKNANTTEREEWDMRTCITNQVLRTHPWPLDILVNNIFEFYVCIRRVMSMTPRHGNKETMNKLLHPSWATWGPMTSTSLIAPIINVPFIISYKAIACEQNVTLIKPSQRKPGTLLMQRYGSRTYDGR